VPFQTSPRVPESLNPINNIKESYFNVGLTYARVLCCAFPIISVMPVIVQIGNRLELAIRALRKCHSGLLSQTGIDEVIY
jgi:hypothetical protein